MKVLLIKLSPIEGLNSSMIRTLSLAKGLSELNNSIDFLTIPISNCHVTTGGYSFPNKVNIVRTKQNEIYDSIISEKRNNNPLKKMVLKVLRKVYRAFSIYDYTHSIAKKIDISLLNGAEYDVVISSSDPKTSHIAVQSLIRQGLKYKRWIQYWGDPMAIDITRKSIYPKWFIVKKEYNLLKGADKIVYVSPFTHEQQKELFPKLASKMWFVPVPYLQKKIYPKPENKYFTIGYFGAYHSKVRDIMPLYSSCVQLGNRVHLDIIGDSDLTLDSNEKIKLYPRGDISKYEAKADLLVCTLNRKGTQIPGKVYHYASTNKPVLVLLDGDNRETMKKYLESFNRYIICDNDVPSIISAINSIIASPCEFEPCRSFVPEIIAEQVIAQYE